MDGKIDFHIASNGLCNWHDVFIRLINNLISGLHPFSDHLKLHGRAWKIHKRELLISEVVPKDFSHRKFESFTCQLNGWGFKCLHQAGNDFSAYYHIYFLRGLPHLIGMMKWVRPYQGKLLPHAEGEPNFYKFEKQFPLSPPMMPCQSQFQCPSSHMEVDAGYGAPKNPQAGHHTNPYQFSSSPGAYGPPSPLHGPPPPFYGHCGDPYALAAYGQMGGYSPSPPHYPMEYGHQPYAQNCYYFYPPGPLHFMSANSVNAPPSGAGAVNSEEVPSAEAVREEVAITPQSNKPASDSLWPSKISAESENTLKSYCCKMMSSFEE
jgi:hypothetical protein